MWFLLPPPAPWAGCSPKPAPASASTPPLTPPHQYSQVSLFSPKPMRRPCGPTQTLWDATFLLVYSCPLTVSMIPCYSPLQPLGLGRCHACCWECAASVAADGLLY